MSPYIQNFVGRKFINSFKRDFNLHDENHDNQLDLDEMKKITEEAFSKGILKSSSLMIHKITF